MNLVFMMTKVHFGGEDRDQSSIYDAMNYWHRKKISKLKSDFFALEELIIHSFQARIAAILWRRLASAGLGDSHVDIDRMLHAQSPSSLSLLINDIVNEYSAKESINVEDQELRKSLPLSTARSNVTYPTVSSPDTASLPRSEDLRDPTTTTYFKINSRAMVLEFCIEVL
jgi:hypothetical protein